MAANGWYRALKFTANSVIQYYGTHDRISGKRKRFTNPFKVLPDPQQRAYSPVKKRMRQVLDNFTMVFKASEELHQDLLFYRVKDKCHRRRPVFLTLTVPAQVASDMDIKQRALHNFLRTITRYRHCKNYVWKAEAQERGAIHFHLVVDCFLFERATRRTWFNCLRGLGCIPEGMTIENASRLVHFHLIEDVDFIGERIGEYFESERDDDGKLYHKHDKSKRVRDIEGRTWGCSDSLRYVPLTVVDASDEHISAVEANALWHKAVDKGDGNIIANIYTFSKAFRNLTTNKFYKKKTENPFEALLYLYHLHHAENIFEGNQDHVPLIHQVTRQMNVSAAAIAPALGYTLQEWYTMAA